MASTLAPPRDEEAVPPEQGPSGAHSLTAPTDHRLPPHPWRHFFFGPPIHTRDQEHARLPKRIALPVFASDAISSVAYATQEILLALGVAGLALPAYEAAYRSYLWSVTAAIVVLLAIVVFSYRQTIAAYPKGGGSYIVTKDNLGTFPGLIAAAALLIDYVLTVAVSIASGAQNLLSTPLFEHYHLSPELVCLFFIGLLTFASLRGLKESGAVFALPTYLFVAMAALMILLGLAGPQFGWHLHLDAVNRVVPSDYVGATAKPIVGLLGIMVALRAFANGCSAMTGTEAISDGVPAFQKPETRNAAKTLTWMAVILASLFLGTSALAVKLHVVYWEHHGITAPAVIDQFSGAVFGKTGAFAWLYYTMQFATAGILVLAANTAYADFPRLASFLANDRFLPKELAHRGDRLVFGRGIMLLGFFAALLTIIFRGSVDRLIPLYALGVFTAFTLSQFSMVKRWARERGTGWQIKAVINGIGALATFVVFGVILYEKAPEGAWMVVVVAGILVGLFYTIHQRYEARARGLALAGAPVGASERTDNSVNPTAGSLGGIHSVHAGLGARVSHGNGTNGANGSNGRGNPARAICRNMSDAPQRNTVLVLVPGIHKGVMPALNYARLIAPKFRAVYIEIEPELTEQVRAEWNRYVPEIELVVLESPYRSLVEPLLDFIDKVADEYDDDVVTLILPESFSGNVLDTMLRSTAAAQIKFALLGREDVVVTNVRYRLLD